MYKLFVLRSTATGQVRTIGITRAKDLAAKRRELLEQDYPFDSLWWLSRGLKLKGYTLEIELVEELPDRIQAEQKMQAMIAEYKAKGHALTNTDIDKNKLSIN